MPVPRLVPVPHPLLILLLAFFFLQDPRWKPTGPPTGGVPACSSKRVPVLLIFPFPGSDSGSMPRVSFHLPCPGTLLGTLLALGSLLGSRARRLRHVGFCLCLLLVCSCSHQPSNIIKSQTRTPNLQLSGSKRCIWSPRRKPTDSSGGMPPADEAIFHMTLSNPIEKSKIRTTRQVLIGKHVYA